MISQHDIQNFTDILQSSHHVRIISHRNPDADSVGSMVAFAHICKHFGKTFDLMFFDAVPDNLMFLTKEFEIQYLNPNNIDDIQNEQTDLVVFVDCGQLNRAGIFSELLLPHQKIINIDHHMSNPLFGDFNCVVDISSTCELLYRIIKKLDIPLTKNLAEVLYSGILTDTGLFQYDKTTPTTHMIAADLMRHNIDHIFIYQHIYQDHPVSWMSMLKLAFEKLELRDNDRAAFLLLKLDDLNQLDFDDTHVIFPIVMATGAIDICVILKEKEDGSISVSLRSKSDDINVAAIASHFGGGGHIRAAGCRTTKYSIEEFQKLIYDEIKKIL